MTEERKYPQQSDSPEEARSDKWGTADATSGAVHQIDPATQAIPDSTGRLGSFPFCPPFDNRTPLYVLNMVSNPARFSRRYKLFKQFEERMLATPGVILYTAEVQNGNRPFEITSASNPRHLQLRVKTVLWQKEAALNVLAERLPSDWRRAAWIDADVQFLNPNWVNDTLHQLEIHDVVQLFQTAIDFGPNLETLQVHQGFAYEYVTGAPYRPNGYGKPYGHCGYAWACTRDAWNGFGRLPEFAILGSGDHTLSLALIGKVRWAFPDSVRRRAHPNYVSKCLEIENKCERHIKRNIGYVSGTVGHFFHGAKRLRRYRERWEILIQHNFDPEVDIRRDWQGMIELEDNKPELRNDLFRYFRERSEDSIDL
jgi:hypothetical protein